MSHIIVLKEVLGNDFLVGYEERKRHIPHDIFEFK